MELFAALYLILALIYISVGIKVLVLDRTNPVNRFFFILTVCLSVWSLSLFFAGIIKNPINIIGIRLFGKVYSYLFYSAVAVTSFYVLGLMKEKR